MVTICILAFSFDKDMDFRNEIGELKIKNSEDYGERKEILLFFAASFDMHNPIPLY